MKDKPSPSPKKAKKRSKKKIEEPGTPQLGSKLFEEESDNFEAVENLDLTLEESFLEDKIKQSRIKKSFNTENKHFPS